MNKLSLLICLLTLTIITTNAQVVRITAGTNLQTAIDNATAGTAFLVEAGNYGIVNVTKRVALIGTGHSLPNADGATATKINFKTGSDQSIITGFTVPDEINIGASGITIQRNRVGNSIYIGYDGVNSTTTAVGGITIKQNLLNRISFQNNYSGALIKSNIIRNQVLIYSTNTGQIINNTILGEGGDQNFSLNNNILFNNNIVSSPSSYTSYITNGFFSTTAYFSHNIIKNGQFNTTDPTNIKLDNVNTVFVGNATNGLGQEAKFQLSSNSPAKGKGIGGVDCGAFGGDEPYVISGIPIGPTVISVTGPTGAAAGQTIQLEVRAKVQN